MASLPRLAALLLLALAGPALAQPGACARHVGRARADSPPAALPTPFPLSLEQASVAAGDPAIFAPPADLPPPSLFVPLTDGAGTDLAAYPSRSTVGRINTTTAK